VKTHKSAIRILLREGLKNEKFLWRHFGDVFLVMQSLWRHKTTAYVTLWSFIVLQSIFKTINWSNHAISDHWNTKISKLSDILSFFLNFDLAKGGDSAPLAPSLMRPWWLTIATIPPSKLWQNLNCWCLGKTFPAKAVCCPTDWQ